MTGQTLLHRQIHPAFFRNDHVQSPAFQFFTRDQGLLSTDDGDRINADAARARFTAKFESAGSMAVTPDECTKEVLPIISDGGTNDLPPEHVRIDFNGLSNGQVEKKAKNLRNAAVAHGGTRRP